MFATMAEMIFGKRGGLSVPELNRQTERSSLSDFLPYNSYEEETGIYLNTDNTIGFIWECVPLCFAGEKSLDTLVGIFRAGLRENSIVQFTLYADPYVRDYVEAYKYLKVRDVPLVRKTTEAFSTFLSNSVQGIEGCAGIPLRNFRLFVSVKLPLTDKELDQLYSQGESYTNLHDVFPWLKDLYANVSEVMAGAMLYPQPMKPTQLIDMMRRLLNDREFTDCEAYDETIPIRKQMIMAETVSHKTMSELKIGEKYFRCITPKSFPREGDPLQTNELFGGIWGVVSDADQIRTPFLYTLNIIFHNVKSKLHGKCNFVLNQKAVGSFAPSLMRKQTEYLEAVDEIEKGTLFVKIMPIFWTWSKDANRVGESISRVKRVWESRGYVMQEDKGILPILFMSALPFGLIDKEKNIATLQRDFVISSHVVPTVLPIQADFAGGGAPVMTFMGRKGAFSTLDLFNSKVNNHNFYIAATSGSGKSFLVNYITYNQFAANGIARIIDIGRSYRKMTKMLNAQFIDFTEDADICINPFSGITDIKTDISTIAAVVMQMIFSATDKIPNDIAETGSTLVKEAIEWAFSQEGTDACIDHVHTYLKSYPQYSTDFKPGDIGIGGSALEDFKKIAHTMAFNLRDFTSSGTYGKWFNGKSTLDISQDEFVVLEVDGLRSRKELFKVVVLQIINAVTQDLYLSDRSRPRLVIFDEAYEFIRGDNRFLGDVIESGYRRARKYRGSFGIVTQSILDLDTFGNIGNVIRSQAAFNFYLESVDFEKARDRKLLDVDDFTLRLMKSMKTVSGKYSEIFMDSPYGKGVARLVVDPFSYYVYTSSASEYSEIEAMVERGMTYDQAIDEMVHKYRS